MNELGEFLEKKNNEVENRLLLVSNLEQIENRVEFAADELSCIHQTESRRLEVVGDGEACKH